MAKTTRPLTSEQRAQVEGYRSGLEEKIADQLRKAGQPVTYEEHVLKFTQPSKPRTYRPDFILPNGIVIESKGRFVTTDRQKHLFIKADYPDLDIRFVFSNPNAKIGKASKTSYAMWCEKNGFLYAHRWIPQEWINEAANPACVAAARRALGWSPTK
ncbi:hypothetical protein [Xanthobacter sp. YC-JY1]|uniref:hypothetical protein n=1 Tax=Xanthobacter sp. YC-JY1 TaxID=2419844 RepID=UPI001F2BA029|nr:hypothetical protein [Xanthobacter sp. YC-JY1]UJX45775.1 endodeoxyribonuclease [Xanthobacter sp. YC-JY1]